jgi:hypothetical protein
VTWVETQSASFTARHDAAAGGEARSLLDDLERFRAELDARFGETPGEVAVVIHGHYAQLAVAQPWLPLAQLSAAPAARRYFGGWFASGEVHVLARDALERRASGVPGSRAALRLSPRHEYAHLVVGASNSDLPPPLSRRSFRGYLRWAWLCEGAATYFSGQHRHLRAAISRRLRERPGPTLPPSGRDAPILGGAVFALLEATAGPLACVELARARLDGREPTTVIEQAFGRRIGVVARAWRDHLEELATPR